MRAPATISPLNILAPMMKQMRAAATTNPLNILALIMKQTRTPATTSTRKILAPMIGVDNLDGSESHLSFDA